MVRRRVYEVLTAPSPKNGIERLLSLALLLLIAANVTASVLETDVEIAAKAPRFFWWFELVSVVIFSIEYVLRVWSCTVDPRFRGSIRGRIRMVLRPMSIIDLASVAPFYLTLVLPSALDLRFLRVLRLLRVFRLLRRGPMANAFATLARVVQAKRVEIGVSMSIVVVAMLLSAGAIYVAEHRLDGTQFTSIPRSMWWAIVTITTIGYGDMTPVSVAGKVIGGFVGFLGICAIALPVGIISSGFMDEVAKKSAEKEPCPHCGR